MLKKIHTVSQASKKSDRKMFYILNILKICGHAENDGMSEVLTVDASLFGLLVFSGILGNILVIHVVSRNRIFYLLSEQTVTGGIVLSLSCLYSQVFQSAIESQRWQGWSVLRLVWGPKLVFSLPTLVYSTVKGHCGTDGDQLHGQASAGLRPMSRVQPLPRPRWHWC